MRSLALLAIPLITGCIVVDRQGDAPIVTVPCCVADAGTELTTVSVVQDHGLALSLASVDGPTACAMSLDDELELGFAGSQLFVRVEGSAYSSCPAGSYPLSGDDCAGGEVDVGCARLRTWDAQGNLVDEHFSVGGAVIVEESGWSECRFEVEVVLPGGEVLYGEAVTEDLDPWGGDPVCHDG